LQIADPGFKEFLSAIVANAPGSTFARYADDPIGFSYDVLGIKILCDQQQEFLTASIENERVAWRTGHGVGKTISAGILSIHRLYSRESIVVTTAPTWNQVELLLWKEIRKLHRNAKKALPGTLLNTRINLGERYAVGRSTDDPNKFQGFHDVEVVMIEDESPGVHPDIHDAIEGTMTAGGLWAKIGNPLEPIGPFYDVFSDPDWFTMAMSSWDHPNVVEDKVIIPGAVTRKWCEDRLRRWGEDSPVYQSRVLGEFPTTALDQLISLKDVEDALVRDTLPTGDPEIWCDPAWRGDDETVFWLKRGLHIQELFRFPGYDATETIGYAIKLRKKHKAVLIGIDADGVGGPIADSLAEAGETVIYYRGSESAHDPEVYVNKRAEAWCTMADTIKHISINCERDFDDLKAQMVSTKRKKLNSKGQIVLVSKDEMRKKGIKSPDRADVIVMAYAPRGAALWVM